MPGRRRWTARSGRCEWPAGRVKMSHVRAYRPPTGPKGKRSVAFALDWPGWSRGAKTPELALETFASYRERYRPVAQLAGLAGDFDAAGALDVVEDMVGAPS